MADQLNSLKALYERRASDRTQFLQRARHNALLTIPSLMPLEGQDGKSHLMESYQGIGSMGVVHLSSRVTVGLLPAGRPYMRLDLPPDVKLASGGEVPVETQTKLSMTEGLVQSEVERVGWRKTTLMSIQQLMVAGTEIEYVQPDNSIRIYRLDQFTLRRDHLGRILELIIMEKFRRDAAPLDTQPPPSVTVDMDEEVELYTLIKLERQGDLEFYQRTQEWSDGSVAGGVTNWEVDELPYLALQWAGTPGEDYGRAKVEEHVADLRSLDALDKAALEMAGMGSRNFIMVRPGAMASSIKNRLVRALNGDVVVGDPDSVDLKSFVNTQGFQITEAQADKLRASLARAFLLSSSGQRDAERVTATEIERDIQELEAALGGTFSALAQDMMERRTHILMLNMKAQGKLPDFPKGSVVPTILTGLEALSRERDVSRAMQAAQVTQAFGDSATDVVKTDVILSRAFIGLGFADAVNTPDETAKIRQDKAQAQQEQAMMDKVVPAAIGAAGKGEPSG